MNDKPHRTMVYPDQKIADLMRDLAAANTRLTRQSAVIEAMDDALAESAKQHRMSMEQFKFYADQHMAKRPPDAEKALTNSNHAARCETADEEARAARAAKAAMEGEADEPMREEYPDNGPTDPHQTSGPNGESR